MPISRTSQARRVAIAISMKRLESNNCDAPLKSPGETSSSPVEKTATRMRRRTSIRVSPSAAASATSCGRILRPAGSAAAPAGMSSPVGRILAPGRRPAGRMAAPLEVQADILLHEYRVDALGDRRSRENANRTARRNGSHPGGARLDPASDGKYRRCVWREVSTIDGVTIDGGVRERRQRQWRADFRRQNAAICISESDGFNVLQGLHPRGNDRYRVVHRHQRSAKREAVFRKLGHPIPGAPSQLARDVLDTDRRCEHHRSDRLNVVEMRRRQARRQADVARYTDMVGSASYSSGLPMAARCSSILGSATAADELSCTKVSRTTAAVIATTTTATQAARKTRMISLHAKPSRSFAKLRYYCGDASIQSSRCPYHGSWNASVSISMKVRPSAPTLA